MQALKISELSIEQKVGLMLLARSPIDEESLDFTMEMIKNRSLGGIHISLKHSKPSFPIDEKRAKELIKQFKEIADYPLLICEDMESGYGYGNIPLPAAEAIGATGSEEFAYEFGRITAQEARQDGFNLVFGPLLDINENPDSCYLGPRVFGGTEKLVSRMASQVVRGYQENGLLCTGKHFPGFGRSPLDSHIDMVTLNCTEEELLEHDLVPYRETILHADLSGVMVGHIMVPKIDPVYPATLSSKLIDLLRKIGFDGLVMTDSFSMVGVLNRFSLEECHRLAMAAGVDMVMGCYRTGIRQSYEWMLKAYRDGMVSEKQIDQAASRVIHAQERILGFQEGQPAGRREYEISERMAKAAITEWLHGTDSCSIDRNKKHLFVIQTGNWYQNPVTGKMEQEACGTADCERELKKWFHGSEFISMQAYPCKPETECMLAKAVGYDSVIMVLYSYTISYIGSSDISKRMLSMMNALKDKLSAVIQFGNPYAVREYPEVPRLIFAYDKGLCYRYAAEALAGVYKPEGKLPVEIKRK